MFNRPGGELFACRRLVAVADAWLVRRVEEFDLSQAVGVGGLTAAAGIAIRSASCQQPRVAARWRSSSDWPLRRRSTASPPIRPAQLLQLLL